MNEKLYQKGIETVIYYYAIPQRRVMDFDRYIGGNENVGFMQGCCKQKTIIKTKK